MSKRFELETQQRIEAVVARVEPLLDLPGIKVSHKFIPGFAEDDHHIVATTETFWQYRTATISWQLGRAANLDEDELLIDAIHEYVHVLIAPMESLVRKNSTADLPCELAVENVARAIHAVLTA